MTQKLSSFKLPYANAAGITLGGNCWFQKNFTVGNPLTWDGVVIDPDGGILGAENLGITVWEDGKKRVQIQSTGISIYGGASVWVPEDWDPANATGVAINSNGIYGYYANTCVFSFANTGAIAIGPSGGAQITYDPDEGILHIPAAEIQYLATDMLFSGELTSGSGVLIDVNGVAGYKSSVKTFGIEASTGNFVFGSTAGKQITFTAASGVLTIGKDVTVVDQDGTPRILGDISRGGYRANLTMDASGYLSQDYTTDGTNYKRLSATNLTNFGTAFTHSQATQNAHGLDLDHINDGSIYKKSFIIAWTLDNIGDGSIYKKAFIIAWTLDNIGDSATYPKAGIARAYAAINSSNQITGAILGTTLINGVAASTVQNNAAVGSNHAAYWGNPHGVNLDNLGDGTTYKKANIKAWTLDNIGDGTGYYLRVGIARATYCIDASYNAGFTTLYISGTSTFIGTTYHNNIYASGNVSALSFTDRTPYPDCLQTAYNSIMSMEQMADKKGHLDHSKLTSFVKGKIKIEDGTEVEGRDISSTVSCLVELVKYLMEKDGYGRKQ